MPIVAGETRISSTPDKISCLEQVTATVLLGGQEAILGNRPPKVRWESSTSGLKQHGNGPINDRECPGTRWDCLLASVVPVLSGGCGDCLLASVVPVLSGGCGDSLLASVVPVLSGRKDVGEHHCAPTS